MATLLGEIPGAPSMDSTVGKNGHVKITRKTRVLVQGLAGERDADILNAPGMPRRLDPWFWDGQEDITCRLISASAKEYDETNHYWHADLTYSNQSVEIDDSGTAPWQRIPRWRWSAENEELHIPRDVITGDPIANSAGDPLHVTAPVAIPVLVIPRYELLTAFGEAVILAYMNKTNEGDFWGASIDQAFMASITGDMEDVTWEPDGQSRTDTLWATEYVIKFKVGDFGDKGWVLELLDHGKQYLEEGTTDTWLPFEDANGNPITGNLDGNGHRSDVPHYLEFHKHKRADFAALKLGPSTWF